MKLKKVWAVYFSGTGTTEKTAKKLAAAIGCGYLQYQ